MERMTRRAAGVLGLGGIAGLAGCTVATPLDDPQPDLGTFQLVAPIVVTDTMKKIPPSRDASGEEWEASLKGAIRARFGGYGGGRDYYIAVAVDGYALAPPGVPVVLTPKSLLVVTANLWTARPQEKVLGPTQLTVFEGPEGLIIGSGLIKSAEEQREALALNMAFRIQRWIGETPSVVAPDVRSSASSDASPRGITDG